jgi:hypothetical protein
MLSVVDCFLEIVFLLFILSIVDCWLERTHWLDSIYLITLDADQVTMHAFLISTHLEHVKQDDWLDSWQDQRDFLPPNDDIFDSTALTLFHMLSELWNFA